VTAGVMLERLCVRFVTAGVMLETRCVRFVKPGFMFVIRSVRFLTTVLMLETCASCDLRYCVRDPFRDF